jgi:16S rRNA (guanine527-N7)-methyltransferase
MTLNDVQFEEILTPFGLRADKVLFSIIRAYIDLLLQWNRKMSLTNIVDPKEIVRLHFGESLFATRLLSFEYGRLADVGSGAGFPGIPIKMTAPGLHLSLIESNRRKAAFLGEVVRKIGVAPVEILNIRAQDLPDENPSFDFITARAVGDHQTMLRWALRHLKPSGKIISFLGLDDSKVLMKNEECSWDVTAIPGSQKRVVLIGSPIQ